MVPEAANVGFSEAVENAKQVVKQAEPSAENIEVVNSTLAKKRWKVLLFSPASSKRYEIDVDVKNGGVMKWKLI